MKKFHDSQEGLTLLEVLVAVAILSIILGVIYSSFLGSSRTISRLEANEDVYQTAQPLLAMLTRELRGAYFDPVHVTGLIGTDGEADGTPADTLNFLTTSYPRERNSRTEEMAEIGYFFDVDSLTGKKRLMKSVDATVDFDFQSGGKIFLLTDQVNGLDLSYFDKSKQEWVNGWDTAKRRRLPDLIRVELSVLDGKDHPIVFKTEIQPMVVQ